MISIISSLYKPGKYLPSFLTHVIEFSDHLEKQKITFEFVVKGKNLSGQERSKLAAFSVDHPWFRFEEIPTEGLYATWNRSVAEAKYEIIGFWNQDDNRYAGCMPEAIELFKQGAELVYFPFKIFRYIGFLGYDIHVATRTIDKQIRNLSRKELQESMPCGPFFLFTKKLFGTVGPFDEQFQIVGDFDWCIRAAKATDKMVLAKALAGEFRVDGHGLSSGGTGRHVAENNIVYLRHGVEKKVVNISNEFEKGYDPSRMLFQGAWYPMGSSGTLH